MTFTAASDTPFVPASALDRVRIVLVRTTHSGNIGAAARAMLTMGVSQLVLVGPRSLPDPEAVARATGATRLLDEARVVETLDEALAGCVLTIGFSARPREFAGRVLAVRDAALAAIQATARGDVALVFGTEMSGLSNAELARCAAVATIPANPDYASLNLAAAVQVATYELRVAAGAGHVWAAPRFARATQDDVESLYAHATRTLVAMKFLNPRMPKRLLPRLRRLFARAGLEREEVNILRGILARIDELMRDRPL
ncbi:MAG: RNA methyltransferase [Betaproteobacteria bacterium]|nr:RNA methyltransferase [Betaproteobacteria bacterium]